MDDADDRNLRIRLSAGGMVILDRNWRCRLGELDLVLMRDGVVQQVDTPQVLYDNPRNEFVAGFIGSSTALEVMNRGEQVIGIDNLNDYYDPALKRARLERLAEAHGNSFTFEQVDFADQQALEAFAAPHSFDRIVHVGAQAGVRYSLTNPQAYVRSNLMGQVNMLELARHREVGHFVYASSSSVYGGNERLPFSVDDRVDHPVSLYAATKKADELMSESYAHLYRIPMTGLRFFTVYGPRQRPDMGFHRFLLAAMRNEPVTVPDAQGALMVAGYNNWSRIGKLRRRWVGRAKRDPDEPEQGAGQRLGREAARERRPGRAGEVRGAAAAPR